MTTTYSKYRNKVVASALSYVGLVGGVGTGDDLFINFYNRLCGTSFSVSTTPWCAIFATYNLRVCDVPTWVCPSFAGCGTINDNFITPNGFNRDPKTYTPLPGDLVFFKWTGSTNRFDHVGLVEKVVGNTLYTIEGNTRGGYSECGVRHKSYDTSSSVIVRYGAIPYESIETLENPFPVPTAASKGTKGSAAYWLQFELKMIQKLDIAIDGAFGSATENALKTFQENNKLTADGILNESTIECLKKRMTTGTSTSPKPKPSQVAPRPTAPKPSIGTNTTTNTGSTTTITPKPTITVKEEIDANTKSAKIKLFQTWLNRTYNRGLLVDGEYGPKTRKASVYALQTELNKQYNRKLAVDGEWGPLTMAACETLKFGSQGNITTIAQGMLYVNGYDAGGFDGKFGPNMLAAIKRFQKANNIGTVFTQGYVTPAAWEKLYSK